MNEAKKIKINFRMPPESAAERAHRLHQQIRKKSGLPDPEEYKRRAAEKQKEIDAMKEAANAAQQAAIAINMKKHHKKPKNMEEAAAIPVGQHSQSISNKAKSQKSSAESRARAMGAAAATRSKNAALRDVIKEPERDVREAALTHYVKVNNALKTTPSGAHVMKFPDKESAQRHAAEHKRRNPNHHVTVTTNANDSTPVWHGGTRTREYAMREGTDMSDHEDFELEEAIKLGSKVMIHAPGKSYHGKTGQVGEIRKGAFKGAPKTYTVDHDDGSIQLSQKNVKLHKEDLDESMKDHIEQSLADKDINAKVEGDKVHVHPDNLSKARYALDKMGVKHSVHGTLKDSVEYCHWEIIDEGWSQGKRNPQRGIKIGDKVRSYDFPGMHDDHYVEGHVVRETPSSYHLRVNKVVRSGKEIPVPVHMAHVEAPKGKGLFSDAYGVHKIMAKQQSVSATPEPVIGGQKTFAKLRGR